MKQSDGRIWKNNPSRVIANQNHMAKRHKLTIEMVPKSSWYENVRSNVRPKVWDLLRKYQYARANYVCEICGGVGHRHPVECHEVWRYNEKTKIQRLERLIALCPKCHRCKHIGLARHMGKMKECIRHLMRVNNISRKEAWAYVHNAFSTWERRSRHDWELDISILPKLITKAEAALQSGRLGSVPPKSANRKEVAPTKDPKNLPHQPKKMECPKKPMGLRNPKRQIGSRPRNKRKST